ncbi:hypothetical protein BU16DRAFT_553989 [Lophium mytilinum]|uniref:Uncharacterized protein n=1 Tax=Lophium mytilinum TaxID=390894 RepID=A0A6A6Q8M2_9PEZI|nr:hypothetical protein BU16DRAFT_553989 [Lophium mytilinum]
MPQDDGRQSQCAPAPLAIASSAVLHNPPAATVHGHHGIADSTTSNTLPPALTPVTTDRQSVSLGVLSSFWGDNTGSSATADGSSTLRHPHDSNITTSNSASTAPPSSLSDPSNPLHVSAALRALNTGAFRARAAAKSTSTRTSLSSQPVVVRTYSGSRRGGSGVNSPRLLPESHSMNGRSPLGAAKVDTLPPVDEFSFGGILRAVDPEIRDAIDAIAEICARSRLSLADEYDAHLPPTGEITTGTGLGVAVGLVGRRQRHEHGNAFGRFAGWGDNTLTAVPEASSSNERLAGESRASTTAGSVGKKSAYGSLKSVISGSKRKRGGVPSFNGEEDTSGNGDAAQAESSTAKTPGSQWAVNTDATPHPSITLVTTPTASKQLSFDFPASLEEAGKSFSNSNSNGLAPLPPQPSTRRRKRS